MNEILARIRVRETAGIRRFLYPLQTKILMPDGIVSPNVGMVDEDETPVPFQLAQTYLGEEGMSRDHSWDFALSLEPFAVREYVLSIGRPQTVLDDPLQVTYPPFNGISQDALRSVQKKFSVSLDWNGFVTGVIYEGIAHLRQPMEISRNGLVVGANNSGTGALSEHLTKTIVGTGLYPSDMCHYEARSSITACKSWVAITLRLLEPKPNDEIIFMLPLAITSPTLTCDFGVGGGIYGKLNAEAAPEIAWRTEFGEAPYAKWSVATAGRVDCIGEVETAEAFLPQRWFHLIDSDKALAVAITKLPGDCQELTVKLTHEGDATIAFRLGDTITGSAEFGVCYHFLNDVPAIAAATNPQSILLPPIVEVLPV